MNDRTREYVFLSYSHKDDISDQIKMIESKGYNIVYDSSLHIGDSWDLKIRRYINNSLCKGVITFISRASLSSKAVLLETDYAKQFMKNTMAISLENVSLSKILATIKDEESKIIAGEIIENFPPEKLYVNVSNLESNTRFYNTLEEWGLKKIVGLGNIILQTHTSNIAGEKIRIDKQQKGYYDFDMHSINQVLNTFKREDLCVLDLGCSSGKLTASRFCDCRIAKVIGLDYNQRDIIEAKNSNYGEKFVFYNLNLEKRTCVEEIKNILIENNVDKVDIVFSALTLHHLNNPLTLLLQLYDVFNKDGKIIVRGSDDGGKMCYPNNELLKELFERYNKLINSVTDRYNGRKLYKYLYDAGYVNIYMDYNITDTCEKSRAEKEIIYEIGFGFRRNRLKTIAQMNAENSIIINEVEWQLNALDKIKEMFCNREFWYCVTSYMAIASVE